MTGLFAPDGCVIPRIRTGRFRIEFTPKCEHAQIRSAVIVIDAADEDSARSFAERWLHQGPLRGQTVIAVVGEERPGPAAAITTGR